MNPDDFPAPQQGFLLTHFLVVSDQDRSREFYQSLFGGQIVLERDPVILKVANSWLLSRPTNPEGQRRPPKPHPLTQPLEAIVHAPARTRAAHDSPRPRQASS